MDEDTIPVVVSLGSLVSRVGHCKADLPQLLPSVIGKVRNQSMIGGMGARTCYVGEEAESRRGILNMSRPIQRGKVENWDDAERLLSHAFYNMLRYAPEEHPVLYSHKVGTDQEDMKKWAQLAFESMNSEFAVSISDASLALHSTGTLSGVVLDSGDATHCTVVYEGHELLYSVTKSNFGGEEVTADLATLLNLDKKITGNIKELYSKVRVDGETTSSSSVEEIQYELPDGTKIPVKDEPLRVTESLFKPPTSSSADPPLLGFADLIVNAIQSVSVDEPSWQPKDLSQSHIGSLPQEILSSVNQYVPSPVKLTSTLWRNIVLCGGNTMFPGLPERLTAELQQRAPPSIAKENICVIAPPNRNQSVWLGGSMIASLSTFNDLCISKAEYDEVGPNMAIFKCFA